MGFVVCGLLRFARNAKEGEWLFMDCFLFAMTVPTHRHCEGLKSPWQSQYGVQLLIRKILLFFCFVFLLMGEFFFFFVFVLTFCGLWIASLRSQWQRRVSSCLWIASLRSQWQYPQTVIARAWKARGNLCTGHWDGQTKLVITRV